MTSEKNADFFSPGVLWRTALFLLFSSPVLWMAFNTDFVGWSIAESTSALAFFFLMIFKEDLRFPDRRLTVHLLLLIAYAALSLLWTAHFHATLTGLYKMIWVLFLLVLFKNGEELWKEAALWSSAAVGTASAVIQIFFPAALAAHQISPNLVAGFISLSGVLCVGIFLTYAGPRRVAGLFAACVTGAGLLLFASLGPILGWIAGCALLFFRYDRKKLPILALVLAGIASAGYFSSGRAGVLFERNRTDPHRFERVRIWKDSLHYFAAHPLLGTGLGTFRDIYPAYKSVQELRNSPYAHNEFLNILCEMGIVGLLILAALVIQVWKFLKRNPHRWGSWGIWSGVFAASLVNACFNFSLRYPPILALFILSIVPLLPEREIPAPRGAKRFFAGAWLLSAAALFALPGIAQKIYVRGFEKGNEQEAARLSARLDPFNGFYRSETGRMRDLLIAIDLEPKNVWYRRSAAAFYIKEWQNSEKPGDLDAAISQYSEIVESAPNVTVFRAEMGELENLRRNFEKQQKK